ncbi:hypothetical protein AAFC00_001210 [Neodothiora populina]|uniref:Cupin type-1 domain-containing protein n=1 Tax=Neodothiora populina TaxID=2781224 RepID=A0ABR3PN99_9PEZI
MRPPRSSQTIAAITTALLVLLPRLVSSVDITRDPELVAKLRASASNLDRRALLANDSDWLYDFTLQRTYTFAPGGVSNANAATFPATVGQGMTMAVLNLGPCSMLPMHWHPRGSNYVYAVHGTTATYMINENSFGVVKQVLTPGKMTVFPQASLHMMMNIGCTNAQLVSALNTEDTGTTNLATALALLSPDLVNAALGYQDFLGASGGSGNSSATAKIWPVGTGSNWGPEACRKVCAGKQKVEDQTGSCGPPAPSGDRDSSANDESEWLYTSEW